ncbi:ketopantoate reductase family protein [Anaerotalea alkaliphila]|uniref:2-dehydropantoate 2-reductase n=1 Tax=Anaerotalea alkaliphila TaxID=2662126 RepID=A0A7X5HUR3_9FIRM|nr:2-dehydropantoate 2-reductase [Anaerotalea alkaliphila]NDL66984.1 2-dehydropantoate 2-reductase [Anaerotalea alkaliphila]
MAATEAVPGTVDTCPQCLAPKAQKTIAVLGAGAMGSLFGALLSSAGNKVHLIGRNREHLDKIRKEGLLVEREGECRLYRNLQVSLPGDPLGPADLVLVLVKAGDTQGAVLENRGIFGKGTVVLTLQNGLGNMEDLAAFLPPSRILAGTTAQGARLAEPGRILHGGDGTTWIGRMEQSEDVLLRDTAALLEEAGIQTRTTGDVAALLWDKLLVNVGINGLTALTRRTNGQLLEHPDTADLLEHLVREGEAVARAKGITLLHPDPVAYAREVCRKTAHNRSSMLQDVERGRTTEIDRMNGAVVREGEILGIPTPANRTITQLVRGVMP